MIWLSISCLRRKDAEDVGYTAGDEQSDIFAAVVHEELGGQVQGEFLEVVIVVLAKVLKSPSQQLPNKQHTDKQTQLQVNPSFNVHSSFLTSRIPNQSFWMLSRVQFVLMSNRLVLFALLVLYGTNYINYRLIPIDKSVVTTSY